MSVMCFSAIEVCKYDGDICVTLCQGQGGTPADNPMRAWADSWQVVAMAAYADLILVQVLPFRAEEFPEYSCTGFRLVSDYHYQWGIYFIS